MPAFDKAWFPVAAWVVETLRPFPEISAGLGDAFAGVEGADSEFFEHLNIHLSSHRADSERFAVLEVYDLCLRLGFLGYYSRPGFESSLSGYRRRCWEELSAHAPADNVATASAPPRTSRATIAVWCAPVAVTVILYTLYRLLLSNLYASVVG